MQRLARCLQQLNSTQSVFITVTVGLQLQLQYKNNV